MNVWMYYTTDGDSGYYNITLFSTEELANKYAKHKNDAYGKVGTIEIQDKLPERKRKLDEVYCFKCGALMVERLGIYGSFWGCSGYPDCKNTMTEKQYMVEIGADSMDEFDYDENDGYGWGH